VETIDPQHRRNMIGSERLAGRLALYHMDQAFTQPGKVIDLEPPPQDTLPQLYRVTRKNQSGTPGKIVPLPTPNAAVADKYPSVRLVFQVVADFYEITVAQLKSRNRSELPNKARHVAVYLASELTLQTISQIAARLGRDPSTLSDTRRAFTNELKRSERLRDEVEIIRLRIAQAMLNAGVAA